MAQFDAKKEERRERLRILGSVLLFVFVLAVGIFLFSFGYVNVKLLAGNPEMATQSAVWTAAYFGGAIISIGTTIYGIWRAFDL